MEEDQEEEEVSACFGFYHAFFQPLLSSARIKFPEIKVGTSTVRILKAPGALCGKHKFFFFFTSQLHNRMKLAECCSQLTGLQREGNNIRWEFVAIPNNNNNYLVRLNDSYVIFAFLVNTLTKLATSADA